MAWTYRLDHNIYIQPKLHTFNNYKVTWLPISTWRHWSQTTKDHVSQLIYVLEETHLARSHTSFDLVIVKIEYPNLNVGSRTNIITMQGVVYHLSSCVPTPLRFLYCSHIKSLIFKNTIKSGQESKKLNGHQWLVHQRHPFEKKLWVLMEFLQPELKNIEGEKYAHILYIKKFKIST